MWRIGARRHSISRFTELQHHAVEIVNQVFVRSWLTVNMERPKPRDHGSVHNISRTAVNYLGNIRLIKPAPGVTLPADL
jgi:hypothetical protein